MELYNFYALLGITGIGLYMYKEHIEKRKKHDENKEKETGLTDEKSLMMMNGKALKMITQGGAYQRQKNLTPILDDLVNYNNQECNLMKNQLFSFMSDNFFELFLFFLLNKIQKYNFINQVSNFKDDLNLLKFISNTINIFIETIGREQTDLDKKDKKLLALACLTYNFFQSEELINSYGYNEKKQTRKDISEKLIYDFATECEYSALLVNFFYRKEINRLIHTVGAFHSGDSGLFAKDPLLHYLKIIDKKVKEDLK